MNPDLLITDINFKVETGRMNVQEARTDHMDAIDRGLAKDEDFKAVTKLIISLMDQTSIAANHVDERLRILRSPNTNPNFLRDLSAIELMAHNALAMSELARKQMDIAVADAEDWRRNDT